MDEIGNFPEVDTNKVCVSCKSDFVIEAGEVRFFNRNKYHLPKNCADCRAKRKRDKEAEQERAMMGGAHPGGREEY